MSYAMTLGLFDWIGDFFKALFNLIPKTIYLLYSSLACLLDILQLFFRKLAGLDVYYVDGVAQTGDLVTNFIGGILGINFNEVTNQHPYPMLTNVFWAMMIFGIIICFVSMLIAIVKAHYSYDAKTTPKQIVLTGGKAIINMLAVPIIVLLGLFVSQALLTAVDSITSVSSGQVEAAFGSGINYFTSTDTVQSATTEYKTIYVRATKYVSGKTYYAYNNETKGYTVVSAVTEENFSGLTLYEAKEVSVNSGSAREKTYLYYDIFGYGGYIPYGDVSDSAKAWTSEDMKNLVLIGAKNQTFSGSLFRVAAYNANRVRIGQYGKDSDNFLGATTFFANAKDDVALADLVDMAFCNNMHLKETMSLMNWSRWDSKKYFTNFTVSWTGNFSKFNVGLVWYYYDLWQFNFIVGFAGCIVCSTIFINIIFGLMTRLIMCLVLFLIAPPLFGLAPIKDAGKGWRENFVKQALMTYGSVVGMNLVMMILPYLNDIDFFNIPIVDYLCQTLFIIVGLISIKAVISTVSGLVGGEDANKAGEGIAEEVGKVGMKAGAMTLGAAKVGMKFQKAAFQGVAAAGQGALAAKNKIGQKIAEGRASKAGKEEQKAKAINDAINGATNSQLKEATSAVRRGFGDNGERYDEAVQRLQSKGMTKEAAENLIDRVKEMNGGKDGDGGSMLPTSAKEFRKMAAENVQNARERREKYENKAIVKKSAAGARMTLAKEWGGKSLSSAGQGARGFASQMSSNLGTVYGENKFGGYIKGEMKKSAEKAKEKEAKAKQEKAEYLKLREAGVSDEENPYYVKPKEEKTAVQSVKDTVGAVKNKAANAAHKVGDQIKGRTGEDKKGK